MLTQIKSPVPRHECAWAGCDAKGPDLFVIGNKKFWACALHHTLVQGASFEIRDAKRRRARAAQRVRQPA